MKIGAIAAVVKEVVKKGMLKVTEKMEKKDAMKEISRLEDKEANLRIKEDQAYSMNELKRREVEMAFNRVKTLYYQMEDENRQNLREIGNWVDMNKDKLGNK